MTFTPRRDFNMDLASVRFTFQRKCRDNSKEGCDIDLERLHATGEQAINCVHAMTLRAPTPMTDG